MDNEIQVSPSTTIDKKNRSYYGVRPDFIDDDNSSKNVYSGGIDDINDLDLNDGKNRYVIMAPDQTSHDIENLIKRKYPKSSFFRINNNEFKMVSVDGKEVAIIHSNTSGKHIILMERPSNRKKSSEQPVNNPVNENYSNYRENDEIKRKSSLKIPMYEPAKKDHYLIVKSKTPLDLPMYNGIKLGSGETYAIPITKDYHDKANALFPYNRSNNESEVISDEDFRKRELQKNQKEIISKVLPGLDVDFNSAVKSLTPEKNDHYALLHVPIGAESDVKKLNGVKKSPKGRYYVMIPKSVHDANTIDKHIILGDMTGYHTINNENNPNRYKWAPNYDMSHAITVEKTLSPEDIVKMKAGNRE